MKTTRQDTREHLLITGEKLCVHRGFTGMGLIELLKVAEVPKGSFYYYFASKEAFGVAMLQRYFARYHQRFSVFMADHQLNQRQRILDYYQQSMTEFCQDHAFSGCLSVKLSAEVCDLSEAMRNALNAGSKALISTLTVAIDRAEREGTVKLLSNTSDGCAQNIYMLWLGASLQSKISRDIMPLNSAWQEINRMLPAPL
uniref:TetR/AcrR family transcriptional regulator n=1 Tax=Pantoea sp. IMH TaxID=1267600 RepID=UPI00046AFEB4|nr:TetR/AcrR family transcriptional regulator [Pantoea sp. IMH]